MKKIYLVPREGLKVPDPEAKDHLPPEGREVADSPYWRRRLRGKEVSLADLEKIKADQEAREILAAIEAEKAAKAAEEARKAGEAANAAEEVRKTEEAAQAAEPEAAKAAEESLFDDETPADDSSKSKAKSKAKPKAKVGEESD